ncbi:glycoside hydrolase family 18 protein [Oceanihabitans sp. IOP_32]|uniref:glycoside hydrolase family 18 protein n=1 Tax=Oceanihabitans sp. IOP_32 TaxID=2529032 RepID=UPI0012940150|nr:glycoside hydrolase family 18 protein [Oceanihabitans sp. IOP_32]QFZ53458.1 glycoside hydrolase family 18 protein [Oceanihabitans sp. IOP_32]
MKQLTYLVLALLFFGCSNGTEKKEASNKIVKPDIKTNENYKIIGYAAGYEDYDFSKIDATKLTHINFAFANIVEGKAAFELETDAAKIKTLIGLKKQNPDLKVLYSVGGWVWSDQFSTMAAFEDSRQIFAESCVELMKKHGFDGVDLDWEYPGQRAEDNIFRPSDKDNFTLLLAAIRKALDEEGKKNNNHYLLTIATGADQAYMNHTDLAEAHKHLDFINVMCYDFFNGWMHQTGHHANLYPSEKDKYNVNSGVEAIDRHIKAGVPVDKLVLGMPFYGRQWAKVFSVKDGLYEPAREGGMIVPYWDIKAKIKTGKYENFYDESAKASYLWNATDRIFISYDTPKEIQLKASYIKEKGLGGAMFWEYSLDQDQELLNELYNGLN